VVLSLLKETRKPREPITSETADEAEDREVEKEISEAEIEIASNQARPVAQTADREVAIAVSSMASDLYLRRHRTPTNRILLRAVITELVAALEQLLGRLHGAFYKAHPDALGSEREFSLADLKSYPTLDDAIEDAVRNRIDAFLRLGFDDWENMASQVPQS
jgi:hypothetical protein